MLKALPVRLAPLPEQRRIVAEIEKQFTRLDAAVADLERAKANLERARASVLKAAVEGRLVPTEASLAQAEGRDYEPASVLLERILDERERKHEEAQEGAKRKKKYKPPVEPGLAEVPELPEGWTWAALEQLGVGSRRFAYGVLVPGPHVEKGGVPLVRVGDIGDGTISASPAKNIAVDIADKFARTYLSGGELLISLVGTIGRVGVASQALRGANVARAVGVLPLAPHVSTDYVSAVLRSPWVHTQLVGAAHEVARKTLNLEDVKSTVVPLPPIVEQLRIVSEVERRISALGAVNAIVELNLARCNRLRQSILKRAFEGKLVPQDPNDEPASELLARIQAEAEAAKPKRSNKKSTRKKKAAKKKAARKK